MAAVKDVDHLLADAFRRVLDAGGWGQVTLYFKRGKVTLIETTVTVKVAKDGLDQPPSDEGLVNFRTEGARR